jgi:hypothetical protein
MGCRDFRQVQPYDISEQLDIFLPFAMMKVFKNDDLFGLKSYFSIFVNDIF